MLFILPKNMRLLTSMHVVSPDIRYGYMEDGQTPSLPAPLKEAVMMAVEGGQKHVDEVKKRASNTNIRLNTEVIISNTSVVKSIVEYADRHKTDLIVIGTKGLSGIKKMLLGSTASGVVTYAHCPVMVVK